MHTQIRKKTSFLIRNYYFYNNYQVQHWRFQQALLTLVFLSFCFIVTVDLGICWNVFYNKKEDLRIYFYQWLTGLLRILIPLQLEDTLWPPFLERGTTNSECPSSEAMPLMSMQCCKGMSTKTALQHPDPQGTQGKSHPSQGTCHQGPV